MLGFIIVFVIVMIVVSIIASCLCIVPQGNAWITETLGRYSGTWEAGLHFRTPILTRVVRKISLKEQVSDFEPQSVITKDNVTMQIDTVVYWRVLDPNKFTYGIERPIAAIENLTATTLRNIIGDLTLDETLTSRDVVNAKMLATLDDATNGWGIDITRVELQNINPPAAIREAMEKQMKAEREKREAILRAEGEKQAAITRAEGEKESAILEADAMKERRIREAEGEATAIERMAQAKAEAIRLVSEAQPSAEYLKIRSMEAAEKMADGKATKLIVPSDMQNLTATLAAVKETLDK